MHKVKIAILLLLFLMVRFGGAACAGILAIGIIALATCVFL